MKLLEYLTKSIRETKDFIRILENRKQKVHSVKAFELLEDDLRVQRLLLNEYLIIYQLTLLEGEENDTTRN